MLSDPLAVRPLARLLFTCQASRSTPRWPSHGLLPAALISPDGKDLPKEPGYRHRMLFDWLVAGGVLATNPAHAVHGPEHVVKRGKASVLMPDPVRQRCGSHSPCRGAPWL